MLRGPAAGVRNRVKVVAWGEQSAQLSLSRVCPILAGMHVILTIVQEEEEED